MAIDLTGKRIVVTGGAGTIGGAAVRLFAAKGAQVLAVDIDEAALKALAAENVPNVHTHAADVSTEDGTVGYVARATEVLGGIDGFFNNASIEGSVAPIGEHPVAEFDRVVATNLRGAFLGLAHVLPVIAAGGSVVNTASSMGLVGAGAIGPYVASKHGVIGLTKSEAPSVQWRLGSPEIGSSRAPC